MNHQESFCSRKGISVIIKTQYGTAKAHHAPTEINTAKHQLKNIYQ